MKITNKTILLSDFLIQYFPGLCKTSESCDSSMGDGRYVVLSKQGIPEMQKFLWMSWEHIPTQGVFEIISEREINIPQKNWIDWSDSVIEAAKSYEAKTNICVSVSQTLRLTRFRGEN